MENFNFLFAFNAIAAFVVGGIVYITGRKRQPSSVWLVYNTLWSVWSFSVYQAFIQPQQDTALFWLRMSLIPIIFIAPVFLHFLAIYSDREIFKNKVIGRVYAIFFLIFIVSFIIPGEFIKGVARGGCLGYVALPGQAFWAFVCIFLGFIFVGFFYLIKPAKKTYLQFRRNQRVWLFYGMFFSILPIFCFLTAFKINVFSYTLFCVIPYLLITGYAIVRYHVLEVNVLFKKMSVMSYTSLFVIAIYLSAVYGLNRLIGMDFFTSTIISGSVILLNILFTAHYGGMLKLNKVAENIVYRRRLAYYKFMENFNTMIREGRDLDTLLYYIVDSLMEIVGIKCVTLYLHDEEQSLFNLHISRGIERQAVKDVKSINSDNPFIEFLRDGNMFVAEESVELSNGYNLEDIKKSFDKINVKLSIPLYYSLPLYRGRDVVAVLNLGNKKNDLPYNHEDIDILNAFGRELSMCIDKAKLFTRLISDDLTNVYRQSYFNQRLDEELDRSKRYTRVFSLALIDVDDFKKVNDVFGHRVGDEVLKKVASTIRTELRKVDITARYGGEEFSVLLPETDQSRAVIAIERIRKAIETEFQKSDVKKEVLKQAFAEGVRFKVTVSVGIAAYRPGIEKDKLIKEADKALYKAKWEGKNRVCIG